MNDFQQLQDTLRKSVLDANFVKLTLSKPIKKSDGLPNVYVRLVEIKGAEMFQFTYHYTTNDKVKNYTITDALSELEILLMDNFRAATLFTLAKDLLVFISKKKKVSYRENAASFKNKLPVTHDKPKERLAEAGSYLHHLDRCKEMLGAQLNTIHNLRYYQNLMSGLRQAIEQGKLADFVDEFYALRGETTPPLTT